MSTSSSSKWPCQPSRFSFQYFDEASDVGLENESGERVRKRKRPGRKPNPPSIQERRAQNRAAQRAFREREQQRRQEKERQWRALVEERDRLKERLAQVEYEANYLRGCLLLFSLSSLVERGTVPHIWTDTRVLPIPWNGAKTLDSIHDKPAILQTLLDPKNHILDFRKALANAQINGCAIAKAPRFNNGTSNTLALKTNPLPAFATSIPATTTTTTTTTTTESYHDDDTSTLKTNPLLLPRQSQEDLSAPTESMVSSFTATQPVLGTITETPTLKTPDDLAHMPPLQALHILRLQLKTSNILGDKIRTAFAPTALQRLIPHDARIDYIPGPALRDRMVLYQGLYNADECFELLVSKTKFVGGNVHDQNNWVAPPAFSEKYWFLSHHLHDLPCDWDLLELYETIYDSIPPTSQPTDNNNNQNTTPSSS